MGAPLYNESEERDRWLRAQAQNRSNARQEEMSREFNANAFRTMAKVIAILLIGVGWFIANFPKTSLVLGIALAVAGTIFWVSTK